MTGTSDDAGPQILCGDWFDDGWVTPYVRRRFAGADGPLRLVLGLYCPDSEDAPITVAVRLGARAVVVEDAVPPGKLVYWTRRFEGPDGDVDISLRTSRPCRSGAGDARDLGIVVTEWRLEPDPEAAAGR